MTTDLVRHVLEYIMWALEHEEQTVSGLTIDWLDKTRDGTPGCVSRTLAKIQLVGHVESLVSDLPDSSKTKESLRKLLTSFASYKRYNEVFRDDADASTLGDEEAGRVSRDPLEALRESLCKTGGAVLDFLFDVFACEHDGDINDLLKKHRLDRASAMVRFGRRSRQGMARRDAAAWDSQASRRCRWRGRPATPIKPLAQASSVGGRHRGVFSPRGD